jgi:hypothetical protein
MEIPTKQRLADYAIQKRPEITDEIDRLSDGFAGLLDSLRRFGNCFDLGRHVEPLRLLSVPQPERARKGGRAKAARTKA